MTAPLALPVLVGIAGGTGSGKTKVATRLVASLPPDSAVLIQHDWYYRDRSHLSPEARAAINFDEPGALDNDALVRDLATLRAGHPVDCPRYDFATHTLQKEPQRVSPRAVVVVEGILLFTIPELVRSFDLRLFVDTDDDLRLLRRIKRDAEERGRDLASIELQYLTSVRPMHALHVAPSRCHAHLVIPEGGDNTLAIDVIVGKLRHLLGV